jgi:hypothetical protein
MGWRLPSGLDLSSSPIDRRPAFNPALANNSYRLTPRLHGVAFAANDFIATAKEEGQRARLKKLLGRTIPLADIRCDRLTGSADLAAQLKLWSKLAQIAAYHYAR